MSLELIEAARVLGFSHERGWPEAFTAEEATDLQCWRPDQDRKTWNTRRADLRALFSMALKAGTVQVTTTTANTLIKPAVGRRVIHPGIDSGGWPEQYTRDGVRYAYTEPAVYRDVTTHHITAKAFAAWLAANEFEPSRLVSAWFKAQAVNTDSRPIAPPADWKAQSPHGLQRLDTTDAGRLVRLADLVQWLMDTRELPCKTAVEEVCSALEQRPSAAAGWLYLLTENGYAKLLTPEHSFFYLPIVAVDGAYPAGEAADKGLAGAIKHMREYWGLSPAPGTGKRMGQHVLDPLAIRIDAAHLLWGYGRRVEAIEQPLAAAPAAPVVAGATVQETTAQRNDRWLRVVDEEEGMGPKVGAQARAIQRIVTDEAASQHKVKKGIQSANAARAERYREGKVSPIKRKSSKPAGPFDALRKKT